MFLRLISAEARKLREATTLLTLTAGPGLAAALVFLSVATRRAPAPWLQMTPGLSQFWLLMLYPFCLTAFAAFAAQVEHRARGWDHVLTLPAPKWSVYAAKAAVVMLGAGLMTVLFAAGVLAGGFLGGLVSRGGPLTGPTGLVDMAPAIALGAGCGLLALAVQFWLSQRFRHFIVPILAGIGGAAVSMAGMLFEQMEKTRLWPWGLPHRLFTEMRTDAPGWEQIVWLGAGGGAVLMSAAILHLSGRDMR